MSTYIINNGNLDAVHDEVLLNVVDGRFPVAITGAGISVASGIPSVQATVHGVPLHEFFEPTLLQDHPDRYYEVYRELLLTWRKARPNAAHYALAAAGVWIITQNVDGLHRDAGSQHVIEMHGNLRELICPTCGQIFSSQLVWRSAVPLCPGCGTILAPGVVLEGEPVRHFARAMEWVGRAQVLFVVGTQLKMDPVKQLPEVAERNGATVVWVNRDAESILPELLAGERK